MKRIVTTALLSCLCVSALATNQVTCPSASSLLQRSGEPHLWVNKTFQMQHFKAKQWLRYQHDVTFMGAQVHYFAHSQQRTRALICYYSVKDQHGQSDRLAYRASGLNLAPLSSAWHQGHDGTYQCSSKHESDCSVTLSQHGSERTPHS